jgi:hypothetical protein
MKKPPAIRLLLMVEAAFFIGSLIVFHQIGSWPASDGFYYPLSFWLSTASLAIFGLTTLFLFIYRQPTASVACKTLAVFSIFYFVALLASTNG